MTDLLANVLNWIWTDLALFTGRASIVITLVIVVVGVAGARRDARRHHDLHLPPTHPHVHPYQSKETR